MDNPKILMIINSPLENAGVPNVVMNIVRNLNDYYTFDVLCYSHQKGYFDEAFKEYGGHIYNVNVLSYPKHRILYPFREVQLRYAMCRIFRQNQYVAVHCHNGEESGVCLDEAKKHGVSVRISHSHGQYKCQSNNPIVKWYYKRCMKFLQRSANKRVACSKIAGKTLFQGADFENMLNPIVYDYYASVVRIAHKGLNLLQIGYYGGVKNQIFSLERLADLRERGINATLTLIGYVLDQGYYQKMIETIERLKLDSVVTLLPSDASKDEYLAVTDCVLMPSFNEGLSLVALESQAAGVPCVVSTGVPEDVNMGLCRFVSLKDKEGWLLAIIEQTANHQSPNRKKLEQLNAEQWTRRVQKLYEQK